jgi:hypothetical protein
MTAAGGAIRGLYKAGRRAIQERASGNFLFNLMAVRDTWRNQPERLRMTAPAAGAGADGMSGTAKPSGGTGRWRPLSLQRRWMCDYLAACDVPTVAAERTIRVTTAAAARRGITAPPGWTAIVLKAYARVAERRPELRWIFLSMPWPHIYEHSCSVATVVIEREWRGETGVFFDQIVAPESRSLRDLEAMIGGLKHNPIESIGGYRRMIRYTRLPFLLRRPLWRLGMRGSGRLHARYFGTFSVNAIGLPRAAVAQTATPLTLSLFLMPVEPPGRMRLCAAFDHRLIDGMAVGRAMGEVEQVINDELAAELRSLAEAADGRAAAPGAG